MDKSKTTFMEKISSNFNNIKNKFKRNISRMGLQFNEDVFSETILKCDNKLSSNEIVGNDVVNYFWVAFKNNTLRDLSSKKPCFVDLEKAEHICDDDEGNIHDMFNDISETIIKEFGNELYKLFVMHANGMGYNELEKISNTPNLKNIFRKIREFVRHKYANRMQ